MTASFLDQDKILANGLRLVGKKFFTIQANERSIYLKKAVWFKSA